MSSPSCPKCKHPLSTYLFPDNASQRVLGFACFKCKVEWFIENQVLKTHKSHTITHKEVTYYEAIPSLSQKPTLEKVEAIADLQRGDQLVWDEFYEHHAIVSDVHWSSYEVIHFARGDGKEVKLRKDHYNELKEAEVAKFGSDSTYDPLVIISRALYMFQHKKEQKYDLFNFNCESFANFCSTGVFKSFQAEGRLSRIAKTSSPTVGSSSCPQTGISSSHSSSCVVS